MKFIVDEPASSQLESPRTAPSSEGAPSFPLWAIALGELGAAVLMLLICAAVFTAIIYAPIGGVR